MYATIENTTVTFHEGTPSLDEMQAVVGGLITTAFRVPSPARKDVSVDVYCNEDGLLMQLPIHWMIGAGVLAGNLIITAGDENTGETIAATEDEINTAISQMISIDPPLTDY